jgi:hypothetical protein
MCVPFAIIRVGLTLKDAGTNQRKVTAGALLMLLPSMYPVAPATMQPTTRPMMILMFFMNGEPNSSVKSMLMKLRKPSPMNCGDPQLDMTSASSSSAELEH